jgi:uncharacterized protein YndB with AHSA1/START domain
MFTVTVATEIAAPVERVFGVFTDLEHSAGRVSNIRNIEMLTVGGFRLGTRWRETREVLGRLDAAEMEVTSFERNRIYTITHHKGGAQINAVFTFAPVERGTRVEVEFSLGSHGLSAGALAPVRWAIGDKVREVLSHDLADLKHFIEQSAS